MKKEHIIYKATNLITNEIYIGQTSNTLHNRTVDHVYEAFKRNRKDKFHSALREFGLKNFKFEENMPKYVFVSPRNTYIKDVGVVLYGSAINGDVNIGDMVSIIDGSGKDIKAQIENIEQEGKAVSVGRKGSNIGILLKGVKPKQIHGDNIIICE